jgi:hypothetical protein
MICKRILLSFFFIFFLAGILHSENIKLQIKGNEPFLKIDDKEIGGMFVGKAKVVVEDVKSCIKVGWFENKLNYLKFDISSLNISPEEGYLSFFIKPVDWESKDSKYHKFLEIRGEKAWILIYHHEGNSLLALFGQNINDRTTWASANFGLNHDFKKGNWYKIEVSWNKKFIEFKVDGKKTTANINKPLEGKIDWIAIGPIEQWGRRDYEESTLIEGLNYYTNPEEAKITEIEKKSKELENEGIFLPIKIVSNCDEFLSFKLEDICDGDLKTGFSPINLPCDVIFDFNKEVQIKQICIKSINDLRKISSYEFYSSNDGREFKILKVKKNFEFEGDKIVDNFDEPVKCRFLKLRIIEGNTALLPIINEISFYREEKEKDKTLEKRKEGLIFDLSPEKLVYKPGEKIKVSINIVNNSEKPKDLKIIVYHQPGIENKEKIYEKRFTLSSGEKKSEIIEIKTIKKYGHIVRGFIYFDGKEEFKDSYFEVLDDTKSVIRMATHTSIGYDLVRPNVNEEKLKNMIEEFYKKNGINYIQLYGWIPEFGVLVPEKDVWSNAVHRNRTLTSKKSINILKKICEEKGIKLIGYDEPGSKEYNVYPPIEFPNDGKRYSLPFYNVNLNEKPICIYGANYLPDLNILTGSDYYSEQMKKSKEIFGWDGFFIDSLVWLAEITAFGKNKNGEKITDLTCDEVMFQFLKKIRDKVGNDFFISANMGGQEAYPLPPVNKKDAIYLKSQELIDGWCFEVPSEPQSYNVYPKRWEELVDLYKNLKNLYEKPNFYTIYNWGSTWPMDDTNLKILYALTHGSRFGIYYHDSRRFYTNFVLRYGELLYSKKLNEIRTEINGLPFKKLSEKLSYYNTEDKTVIIHLINVNPEKEIWKAKDIYPVIENKEIEIYIPSFEKKPKKVLLIKADDEKNDPEEIDFIFEGKKIKLLIPYLKIWDILVLQF